MALSISGVENCTGLDGDSVSGDPGSGLFVDSVPLGLGSGQLDRRCPLLGLDRNILSLSLEWKDPTGFAGRRSSLSSATAKVDADFDGIGTGLLFFVSYVSDRWIPSAQRATLDRPDRKSVV